MTNSTLPDPFAFMKDLWGTMSSAMPMSMPSMVAPTLNAEELQKKITDLKVVEGWLNMNLTLLRSTIQTLELQLSGLQTLQQLNDSSQNLFTAALDAQKSATDAFASSPLMKSVATTTATGKATDKEAKDSDQTADKSSDKASKSKRS